MNFFLCAFLLLTVLAQELNIYQSHKYWFLKYRQAVDQNTRKKQQKRWNYCDLKCLYLQNYFQYDFVVLSFREKAYRPDFGACYIKKDDNFIIWSQLASNKWFQKYCGMDLQDYDQNKVAYELIKVQGEGRNSIINY